MSDYASGEVGVVSSPPVIQGTNPWIVAGTVTTTPINLALRAESDGNSLLVYFADAPSGSATSAAVWRIRKLIYDGNGNFAAMTWPNGVTTSTFVWDDRATYTYS